MFCCRLFLFLQSTLTYFCPVLYAWRVLSQKPLVKSRNLLKGSTVHGTWAILIDLIWIYSLISIAIYRWTLRCWFSLMRWIVTKFFFSFLSCILLNNNLEFTVAVMGCEDDDDEEFEYLIKRSIDSRILNASLNNLIHSQRSHMAKGKKRKTEWKWRKKKWKIANHFA